MQVSERYTQNVAMFLIVFAAICIALGCHFEWRELIGFATAFGGGGVGILTGTKLSAVTNKDGGTINVNPTEPG